MAPFLLGLHRYILHRVWVADPTDIVEINIELFPQEGAGLLPVPGALIVLTPVAPYSAHCCPSNNGIIQGVQFRRME
jgi:hypothetical protein